jgi:hypothetical protein
MTFLQWRARKRSLIHGMKLLFGGEPEKGHYQRNPARLVQLANKCVGCVRGSVRKMRIYNVKQSPH